MRIVCCELHPFDLMYRYLHPLSPSYSIDQQISYNNWELWELGLFLIQLGFFPIAERIQEMEIDILEWKRSKWELWLWEIVERLHETMKGKANGRELARLEIYKTSSDVDVRAATKGCRLSGHQSINPKLPIIGAY